MSDAAFRTGKYPAYTTAQLEGFIAAGEGHPAMIGEIERRAKVAAGDVSVMTPGERLRHIKAGG